MAKAKTTIRPKKDEGSLSRFSIDKILPQKYHVPVVILIIILMYLIFLNPLYFGGKTFESGDISTMQGYKSYLEKDRDGFTLWNPYIFCGMPAYATGTAFTWFNLIYAVVTTIRNLFTSLFSVDYVQWTFYLILLGITSFFLMRHLTKNTLVSLFTGLATAFSTGIIVFLFIGHVTKLTSLCIFPLIFLMLLRMQEKIRLLDFILLTIALQIFLQGFHVQIIFYTLFSVSIYFLYYFIRSLVKKDIALRKGILKSAGIFAAAAVIAILIQSDSLTQVYEYTPYSTRGTEGILEKQQDGTTKSEYDYYEYHTDWSFSPGEVLTFIVPSWYGFGRLNYNFNGQEVGLNTYFGQMRFVDVAMYMGVLVFFLALYAVFTRFKEPFVQFLAILAGIALLISFGRTFPVLFDLMFYNFPYFDKFRVPSMILVIVQVTLPILAGLGLMKIISLRTEKDQRAVNILKYAAYAFSAVFVLVLLFSSAIGSSFSQRLVESGKLTQEIQYFTRYGIDLSTIAAEVFTTDLILAMLFTALLFWLSYSYVNSKISADILVILVILITIIDLWRIDSRGATYTKAESAIKFTEEPTYITAIKRQDNKTPYRIINLKQDNSPGSVSQPLNYHIAFLVEDVYGYSGIKPRAYQDIIDVVGTPANPTIMKMLNVKYIVLSQPVNYPGFRLVENTSSGVVYENTEALPRVFLADSVAKATPIDFLNMVKANSFDPKHVVFVHDKEIKTEKPDSTAGVKITGYLEDKITADVNASGNNFLFFSTTYLPTGWKASIDGNKTDIIRANHGFMGIIVPKGNHKVVFIYSPDSFYISKYTALILSSLVMAGLVFGIFLTRKKAKTEIA